MAKMKGLGKGLDALLGDDFTNEPEVKSSLFLPISQVESCAAQPRKQFDPDALADLADSIRQHGIIQPLTVRKLQSGYYQIIAGERRWRAAKLAGLREIPVVVIEADDRKAMELAMIENLQREDLNPMEEAEGYRTLMEQYGLTQEETSQRVGKSRSAVANALRLLNLSKEVRALVEEGGVIEWVSGSFGSHVGCLYPMSILKGDNSRMEFTGVTFAGAGQDLDTGAKVVHVGKNTSSYMNTRSISKSGGVSTFRSSVGDGCAISQASADIVLGMIVGKQKDAALKLGEMFLKMIQGEATEEEIDSLEEASALRDIAHMPARVKCAVLGWRTLKEALQTK